MSTVNYRSPKSVAQINSAGFGAAAVMIRPDLAVPDAPPELPPEPPSDPGSAPPVPFNREAEEAVVGSVIIYADIFPSLADVLKPADFYIRRHGWIWEAFSRLTARGEPIDYRTTCDELARMG
jgi:hypothetical protein